MMRSRRAVSIIELMVILSATTVVLSLTSVLLQRGMRLHTQSRADLNSERNAARLADQFRRDVHRATAAVANKTALKDNAILQLTFSNGEQTEYSYQSGTVLRTMTKENGRVAREEYVFPKSTALAVEEQDTPSGMVLTLTAERPSSGANKEQLPTRPLAMPMSLQVGAMLGRDGRFESAPQAAEAQN